ncbi:MAG: hypothetical protein ACXABG_15245 [Promethearchaeota archaeon]|jgi:hypothetical protein
MSIKLSEENWKFKIAPLFTLIGVLIIMTSFVIGTFIVAPTAQDYWGTNSKSTRDAATGDPLLADLGTLATTPKWLEPFTFLGVALFMLGIALFFSTIPGRLQQRGQFMSEALEDLRKGAKQ